MNKGSTNKIQSFVFVEIKLAYFCLFAICDTRPSNLPIDFRDSICVVKVLFYSFMHFLSSRGSEGGGEFRGPYLLPENRLRPP